MSENVAFMESNLVEGQHGHLALTMTAKDYLDQTDHDWMYIWWNVAQAQMDW